MYIYIYTYIYSLPQAPDKSKWTHKPRVICVSLKHIKRNKTVAAGAKQNPIIHQNNMSLHIHSKWYIYMYIYIYI